MMLFESLWNRCSHPRSGTEWKAPPERPVLGDDEVHLWLASLQASGSDLVRFASTLSEDENQRASRFIRQEHRNAFIAGRGILRAILSRYTGLDASAIRFTYGYQGKPDLAPDCNPGSFRFNLSHSGGKALYAVTKNRSVGVDIERVRLRGTEDALARRFFSMMEVRQLERLTAEVRNLAFFHCWARKEAYIKAIGGGLSVALHSFEVSVKPGEPVSVRCGHGHSANADMSIREVSAGEGFAAAVAAAGKEWRVRLWQW